MEKGEWIINNEGTLMMDSCVFGIKLFKIIFVESFMRIFLSLFFLSLSCSAKKVTQFMDDKYYPRSRVSLTQPLTEEKANSIKSTDAWKRNKAIHFQFQPNDDDLKKLRYLEELEFIDFKKGVSKLSNLKPLIALAKLKGLVIRFDATKKPDLSALKKCKKLRVICFGIKKGSQWRYAAKTITSLKKLRSVELYDSSKDWQPKGKDFKCLSSLKSLEQFVATGRAYKKIKDLSFLKKNKKLQRLWLGSCLNLTDISALRDMKRLRRLNLPFNKITNISALANKPKLEFVKLGKGSAEPSRYIRD